MENNKTTGINSHILIITLNINRLNTPLKIQTDSFVALHIVYPEQKKSQQIFKKCNYIMYLLRPQWNKARNQ